MIDYNVLLTTISTAAALLFGYFAFTRGRRADDKATSEHITKISADVQYIRDAIDELKDRQAVIEVNYKDLLGRICRLEAKIER